MAIYKITNKINGMIYIGQTTQKDPYKRIKKHFEKSKYNQFYLQNAIVKYGKENFLIEILNTTIDINILNQSEKEYISLYNCMSPLGYNLKMGGNSGGACSEETKNKISKMKKGKPNYKLLGRKFSESHKNNLSLVRKGKPETEARKMARYKSALKLGKAVIAFNIKTKDRFEFVSIQECSIKLNLIASCISRVLKNDQNRSQHKGWTFEYKKKEENI